MDQTFEKRKKIIYEFICDDMYVPMKLKELAILLQVPKEQRSELKAVMDALEAEGKVQCISEGKVSQGSRTDATRCLSGTPARIWLCNDRRGDR